jgi:uncharacterized protein (DUF1810 family)
MIIGTLLEEVREFMIISRSVILRTKNVSDKLYRKSKHIFSHFSENRAVYETMWKIWYGQASDENEVHALCMPDS